MSDKGTNQQRPPDMRITHEVSMCDPIDQEIMPPATDTKTFMLRLYQLAMDAKHIQFDALTDAVNASSLCDMLQERIQQSVR